MVRLELVMADAYMKAYVRALATYKLQLGERERKIEATRAARETVRKTDGESSSTSLMLLPLESSYPAPLPPPSPWRRFLAYGTSADQLLDVIDGLLALLPYKPAPPASNDPVVKLVRRARKAMRTKDQREILQQLLDDGRMIYRVRPDGLGLERRVNPVAHAQAITAADAAEQAGLPAAGERLLAAWNSVYALKPDPSSAYRDAIRAVEAVANPLFLPTAPAPTLGQVIRHLDQHGSDYDMVIASKTGSPADVGAVIAMMRLLWEGHRDRHEGGPTTAERDHAGVSPSCRSDRGHACGPVVERRDPERVVGGLAAPRSHRARFLPAAESLRVGAGSRLAKSSRLPLSRLCLVMEDLSQFVNGKSWTGPM